MTVPHLIAEALAKDSEWLDGEPALGRSCDGAKHHSPNPIVLHRIETPSTPIFLCGTCRDNVHVFRGLAGCSEEPLPWPLRREFGNLTRAIGEAWVT